MKPTWLIAAVAVWLGANAAAAAQEAPAASAANPTAAAPFTVDDAIDLTRVSDPRLSPDGTRLLFTRATLDWDENERPSRIWIANADGSEMRAFTSEDGDGSARWSPDGRWVAFLRSVGGGDDGGDDGDGDDEERRQIFLLPLRGGEALQLTEHPTSVERFEWMPGSQRLIFLAEDSLGKEERKAREAGADAFRVDEGPNGQNRGQWSNLWWVAANPDSGRAEPLTEGERMVDDFAVSPDGGRVAFTHRTEDHRNDEFRSEIVLLDIATQRLTRLTENAAPESSLAWSPDGRTLTFMAPDLSEWRLDQGNLYALQLGTPEATPDAAATRSTRTAGERATRSGLEGTSRGAAEAAAQRAVGRASRGAAEGASRAEVEGASDAVAGRSAARRTGPVRELTAGFAGAISDYAWAPDGQSIYLVALERTTSNLYRLAVGTGAVERVTALDGMVSSPSYSRDRGRVAFAFSSPAQPVDIYVSPVPAVEPVRVTDANPWIRSRALAAAEAVHWTSRDGLDVEGLLYLPPDGRSAPGAFVLEIHGGPAGVFTQRFDADAQVLAAYGYAVLQPNVRGSRGYGDALLRGNMEDLGGGDFDDLMTGVAAMIERGIAHSDSLAIKGWSYGGILGGWTLTRTDRFRAASLGAMVADWRSEFGAGFNFDVVRWYLGGDPWSNADFWIERSSYTHLDRVSTPTILFHGERDRTDTIQQTMNFHAGLRHFGVPTRFIRFPREGHGIREPRHERIRLVEELRWFQHYVRGDEAWQAPERPEPDSAATVAGR